jgi:UDP-N-acetylmuramyl pentapeptide phosphotransferase/UDP-N-acetylglucosamine-1-phosphate transferase
MHRSPLPVGAGAIAIFVMLGVWFLHLSSPSKVHWVLLVAGALLAVVSWIDDLRGLPIWLRLTSHALAIIACLSQLPSEARLILQLPLVVERTIEALAWLWFVNLFNFMDGIDGLAGSEAVTVALGYLAAIAALGAFDPGLDTLAMLIVATMLGYLIWNWHPARVMMGDAGSIPLGFLLGFLMLDLCFRGAAAAAFILPLFFLADSTYTLLARMTKGKLPYQAHRDHFYQRAAIGCGNHATVVTMVLVANGAFGLLALLSTRHPVPALILALLGAAVLFAALHRLASVR